MYDLTKITDCISHSEKITSDDIELFANLADEHAYSPVFSILYLKALSLHNPLSFEQSLKDHAYKIPSRARLYELIQETKETDFVQEETIEKRDSAADETTESSSIQTDGQEEKPESIVSNQEEAQKETINEVVPDTEPQIDENDEQNIIEEDKDTPENIDASVDSEKEKETEKTEFDALEKEMLAHAVGASISLEVDQYINEETFEKANQVQVEEQEEIDPFTSNESDEKADEKREVDFTQTRSFTEWLTIGSAINDEDEPKKEEIKPEKKKNEINIHEKKEIKPFFSAVEKAKESLDYSGIPMTETLAKIYDAQGNFPRALEAYEQLILKIPEKKVFFALQIEKLKKKLIK
jgi:hypothetical protein